MDKSEETRPKGAKCDRFICLLIAYTPLIDAVRKRQLLVKAISKSTSFFDPRRDISRYEATKRGNACINPRAFL